MKRIAPWLFLAACSTHHGVRSSVEDARAPSAETADASANTADASPPAEAPVSADAGIRSCDTRLVTCRRAEPVCGELEAPRVEDGCWGPCVPIAECACRVADDCPDRGRFTCHLYAAQCGPYVR